MEAVAYPCVPQDTPLSTPLHMQMSTAVSHRSGSWPLASVTPSVLDPRWDPVAALCCGDPVALDQQDRLFHRPHWLTDNVDLGKSQRKAQDLGLVVAELALL